MIRASDSCRTAQPLKFGLLHDGDPDAIRTGSFSRIGNRTIPTPFDRDTMRPRDRSDEDRRVIKLSHNTSRQVAQSSPSV